MREHFPFTFFDSWKLKLMRTEYSIIHNLKKNLRNPNLERSSPPSEISFVIIQIFILKIQIN